MFMSFLRWEKGKVLTQSMTNAPTPTEKKTQKKRDNTETKPKTSITQRLRTDLGRSIGVTIAIRIMCLIRLTVSPTFPLTEKVVLSKGHTLKKIVNNPPYEGRGPNANLPGEAIKLKKRLLLRWIHHFESDWINNVDHMRISGTEPSWVILSQRKWFKKLKINVQKCPNKVNPKGMV